jgi:hypothetical protein
LVSETAVLVVDMLNAYRYVNDNYGDFTADFGDIVDAAPHGERPDPPRWAICSAGCRPGGR